MSAQILDGKQLAAKLIVDLQARISKLHQKPVLVAIHLLQDPSIESYAASQARTAEKLGIEYRRVDASGKSQDQVIEILQDILKNPDAAIFIFTPTPKTIDLKIVYDRIRNIRGIEGVYPNNVGLMFLGWHGSVEPPTPAAAMQLLKSTNVALAGKTAVIIGRSNTVGKPLMHLLLAEDVTVSVCHSKTPQDQMIAMIKAADIVCACLGKPFFVKKDWVKQGAMVIDIGINQVDGKIVGDVSPDVKDVAGYLSPVPGGVGPVTSVCLMANVIEVLEKK